MSHNIFKLNNRNIDSNGNINLTIEDYVNISSVNTNNIVKYDGSNWINNANTNFPASLTAGWYGHSGSFSNGSYYYRENHYFINRKASGTSDSYTSGASLNDATHTNSPLTSGSNSNWFESITLVNAGTYLCMYNINCNSGNSISFRWSDPDGNFIGNKSSVKNSNNFWGSICTAIITTTSISKKIRLVCTDYSGNVQLNEPKENESSSMTIIKLG